MINLVLSITISLFFAHTAAYRRNLLLLVADKLVHAVTEDATADVLRGTPYSAHISGSFVIPTRRITHLCLSVLPLVGAHEGAVESVHNRPGCRLVSANC